MVTIQCGSRGPERDSEQGEEKHPVTPSNMCHISKYLNIIYYYFMIKKQ